MNHYVMDSYSFLAYAESENGAAEVKSVLKKALAGEVKLLMSVINWGEVYYITLREKGKGKAEEYLNIINQYPISIIDADKSLTLAAAAYKAFYKMSYADAFAAALTKASNATLITGDKEFNALKNEINIHFI